MAQMDLKQCSKQTPTTNLLVRETEAIMRESIEELTQRSHREAQRRKHVFEYHKDTKIVI